MSYGSWLVVTCLGIAPCYATLELIDFLEISVTDLTDIVSSRDPLDLKTEEGLRILLLDVWCHIFYCRCRDDFTVLVWTENKLCVLN